MGARVYVPGLGRFLSVDPQPDGNDNAYTYVNDPVNGFDLDGNAGWFDNIRKGVQNAAKWTWQNRETIGLVASVALMVVPGVGPAVAAARVGAIAYKAATATRTLGIVAKAGNVLAKSKYLGTTSKLLGNNKFVNPAGYGKFSPGKWNMPGRNFKIGWSNIGNRYELRIGILKKSPTSNISKYHIPLIRGGKVRGW